MEILVIRKCDDMSLCVRIEVGSEATAEEGSISESKAPAVSDDREKILELIADIGSGSETMMANYKESQVQRQADFYGSCCCY